MFMTYTIFFCYHLLGFFSFTFLILLKVFLGNTKPGMAVLALFNRGQYMCIVKLNETWEKKMTKINSKNKLCLLPFCNLILILSVSPVFSSNKLQFYNSQINFNCLKNFYQKTLTFFFCFTFPLRSVYSYFRNKIEWKKIFTL